MGCELATFVRLAVAVPGHRDGAVPLRSRSIGATLMTAERRERLTPEHRLTSPLQHAAVKDSGVAFRGRLCLMLVLARPGEPTRFGFVASRKAVGGAVQRNRARRRLRELVRRRWPRLSEHGYWIEFIAFRGVLAAPHQELATEVEHLLACAGALAPTRVPGTLGHA
jgi:ribonuclease P protein component